jgi:hypothetical protein
MATLPIAVEGCTGLEKGAVARVSCGVPEPVIDLVESTSELPLEFELTLGVLYGVPILVVLGLLPEEYPEKGALCSDDRFRLNDRDDLSTEFELGGDTYGLAVGVSFGLVEGLDFVSPPKSNSKDLLLCSFLACHALV